MSEQTVNETTESVASTQAASWAANTKAIFEQHIRDVERERNQVNDWHAFSLEQARQNQQIVNRLAQDAATLSTRIGNDGANFSAAQTVQMNRQSVNAGTSDQLFSALQAIIGSEILNNQNASQTAAERLSAETAKGFQDTAKAALDTVIANAAQASPLPQGTTGVAQGAMQAANSVATSALLDNMAVAVSSIASSMTELNKAMAVLLLRVTGDVVVANQ